MRGDGHLVDIFRLLMEGFCANDTANVNFCAVQSQSLIHSCDTTLKVGCASFSSSRHIYSTLCDCFSLPGHHGHTHAPRHPLRAVLTACTLCDCFSLPEGTMDTHQDIFFM